MYLHTHTHILKHTHTGVHTRMFARSHKGAHLYMCTFTHAYINTKGDWVKHQHLSALLVPVGGRKQVLG